MLSKTCGGSNACSIRVVLLMTFLSTIKQSFEQMLRGKDRLLDKVVRCRPRWTIHRQKSSSLRRVGPVIKKAMLSDGNIGLV